MRSEAYAGRSVVVVVDGITLRSRWHKCSYEEDSLIWSNVASVTFDICDDVDDAVEVTVATHIGDVCDGTIAREHVVEEESSFILSIFATTSSCSRSKSIVCACDAGT